MALWRCPHCGTPQPVTARCWVCRRSSTSCGTCRHFRSSVAANIGYCGLDRERQPLAGDEIRGCWDGIALHESDDAPPPAAVPVPVTTGSRYVGGFVPVDELLAEAIRPAPVDPAVPLERLPPVTSPAVVTASPSADGMLWAELES